MGKNTADMRKVVSVIYQLALEICIYIFGNFLTFV